MKQLISKKRNKDESKHIKQSDNDEFAVVNSETEASKISENNDITIN